MLEALGNLGDFIGGIAVVATLIYLAIQVRQNTAQLHRSAELSRVEARDSTFEAFSSFREQVISSPDVAALYYKGATDPGSLDPVERLRFNMLAEELFYILNSSFTRHNALTEIGSEAGSIEARELGVEIIIGSPGIARWWSRQKERFDPDFVQFIDSEMAAIEAVPSAKEENH